MAASHADPSTAPDGGHSRITDSRASDHELPRADIGVLFVHGIGSQSAGSTLEAFGGPFLDYASERLDIEDGSLAVARTGGGWDVDVEVGGQRAGWRLEEAWWAASFPAPTHVELARWAIVYAPWLVQRDALRYLRRGGQSAAVLMLQTSVSLASSGAWVMFQVLRLVAMTVIAVVAQALLLLTLPFAPVLRRLLRLFAESLGDCYAFVAQPESYSAMVDEVVDALDRLSRRCTTVIVVAHSQGAAVAHAALLRRGAPNVVGLITLGQGLHKLSAASLAARHHVVLGVLAVVRAVGVAVAVVVFVRDGPSSPVPWLTLIAMALFVGVGQRRIAAALRRRVAELVHARPKLHWTDFWSMPDPVPGGLLPGAGEDPTGRVESLRAVNESSWLHDHTSYQRNNAQVQSCIYGYATALAGLPRTADTDAAERQLIEDRIRRLRAFWWGRICVWISVPFGASVMQPWLVLAGPWSYLVWWAVLVPAGEVAWRLAWRPWHRQANSAEARLKRTRMSALGWRSSVPLWFIPGAATVLVPLTLMRRGWQQVRAGNRA